MVKVQNGTPRIKTKNQMNLKKVTNTYLILCIILFFCFPFTGVIALSYAIRSRNKVRSGGDEDSIAELLDNCYRWITTTVKIFIVVYVILLVFFMVLPNL